MIIQIHSPLHTTDLKRAFDQVLLLMVEQDVTWVTDVHLNLTVWSGDKQVEFVNKDGQLTPVRVEPYPDRRYWVTTGSGKFRFEAPKSPKWKRQVQQQPAEQAEG